MSPQAGRLGGFQKHRAARLSSDGRGVISQMGGGRLRLWPTGDIPVILGQRDVAPTLSPRTHALSIIAAWITVCIHIEVSTPRGQRAQRSITGQSVFEVRAQWFETGSLAAAPLSAVHHSNGAVALELKGRHFRARSAGEPMVLVYFVHVVQGLSATDDLLD